MIDFILHLLVTNSIETIFLMSFIFTFIKNNYNLLEKTFIFICLDVFSNRIQYISSPSNIILGILMYWVVFICLDNFKNKFKLLEIICTGFFIIAAIQFIIYSPLILFLNLDIGKIHSNIFYLIVTMLPIDIIEILLIIIIRRKREK